MNLLPTQDRSRMVLVPMELDDANLYVERHHRHSVPVRGHKFSLGATYADDLVGVAIVGRPVGRGNQDGWTLEALRVCTTGHDNACSFLYGACWRATRTLGYRRLITYTRQSESSLRAAGFRIVGEVKARSWDTPSRPRVDRDERLPRWRWEVAA